MVFNWAGRYDEHPSGLLRQQIDEESECWGWWFREHSEMGERLVNWCGAGDSERKAAKFGPSQPPTSLFAQHRSQNFSRLF